MGSKAGEEVVVKMEESDEKTRIKLDSEMNKYEPNSNFSGVSKKFETLPSPSFSKLLEGVVLAANSSSSSNPSPQPAVPFQGQFVMSHQEALGTITAIAAHALRQTKSQDESVKSLIKLPISQSETVSSNPSVVAQQAVSSLPDKSHVEKGTAKIFSTQKSENKSSDQQIPDSQSGCVARVSLAAFPSAQEKVVKSTDATPSDVPKTPKSDGYSWRKYGQKQIKSSGSSRSYFRCTNLSCSAKKKVQHLDGSGEILDVVYKGNHNHDPPPYVIKGFSRKKVFSDSSAAKLDDPCTPKLCSTEPKPALQWTSECQDKHSISPVCTLKTDVKEHDIKIPNTTIRLEGEPSALPVKVENNRASSSNGLPLTATKNERDIPIKKRRIKESGKECSEFVYRTFKEPKVVVLPADLGISSDGYRWRKYGQKMVKGNSHPRSYYRCSTAGCPVRKHVERATDGSSSIVAMYEGEHDHDKPVPKKQHSWAKSPLPVNPQTNTINNVPLINSEEKSPSPGRGASPAQQCEGPNNNDSGEQNTAPKPGPEKVLEAAQARASLGIELKSC